MRRLPRLGFKHSSTLQTYTPPYYQRTAIVGPPPTFQAAWAVTQGAVLPTGIGVRIA